MAILLNLVKSTHRLTPNLFIFRMHCSYELRGANNMDTIAFARKRRDLHCDAPVNAGIKRTWQLKTKRTCAYAK